MPDPSNGYEATAAQFITRRSRVGAEEVRAWARALPRHAHVLDVGCGGGVPITEMLLAEGCQVAAVDAAPSLVAAFRERFPDVPIACEAAESSALFDRTYDGIVAWGLMFLLRPAAQRQLIAHLSRALRPGGALLFTSPAEPCTWTDVLTRQRSESLGAAAYREALASHGVVVEKEFDDEGGNHYYVAVNRTLNA